MNEGEFVGLTSGRFCSVGGRGSHVSSSRSTCQPRMRRERGITRTSAIKACRATAVVSVALLLTVGCGTPWLPEEDAAMSMREAAERADEILDRTFDAIKPAVHWTHGQNTEGSCDVSRRRAVMTIVSPQRRGSFIGVVERHWKREGLRQIGVNRNTKSPATFFQTPDKFNVRLLVGGNGQMFFSVATPCVEESSVASPKSVTLGPNYAGGPIPHPDIKSNFWSDTTPIPS